MSIAESVYTYLSGNATVTAQTSSIYPQMLPQTNPGFPALTYGQDDEENQTTFDGTNPLKFVRFSIDCWDTSYKTAHDLADVVIGQMVGFRGTFGSHTAEQITIERHLDIYEWDTSLHRVSLQFRIAYS